MRRMQRAGLDTGSLDAVSRLAKSLKHGRVLWEPSRLLREPKRNGEGRDLNPHSSQPSVSFHAAAALLILLATPVYAQERPILDRAVDLANGAALVAHSADLATTVTCLAAKTCTEANPLLIPHVSNPKTFFALKMGTALGSYWVKTQTKRHQPVWTLVFASAETVAFSLIAHHNWQVHQKAQGR